MARAERAERTERSDFDRYLNYRSMHTGWLLFRSVYWAIYLLVIGGLLLYYNKLPFGLSLGGFFGVAIVLFAVMLIIYGAAESLHHKLMKRYA